MELPFSASEWGSWGWEEFSARLKKRGSERKVMSGPIYVKKSMGFFWCNPCIIPLKCNWPHWPLPSQYDVSRLVFRPANRPVDCYLPSSFVGWSLIELYVLFLVASYCKQIQVIVVGNLNCSSTTITGGARPHNLFKCVKSLGFKRSSQQPPFLVGFFG